MKSFTIEEIKSLKELFLKLTGQLLCNEIWFNVDLVGFYKELYSVHKNLYSLSIQEEIIDKIEKHNLRESTSVNIKSIEQVL